MVVRFQAPYDWPCLDSMKNVVLDMNKLQQWIHALDAIFVLAEKKREGAEPPPGEHKRADSNE